MTEYCVFCKGVIGDKGLGTYFCYCDVPRAGATYLEHLGFVHHTSEDMDEDEFKNEKE